MIEKRKPQRLPFLHLILFQRTIRRVDVKRFIQIRIISGIYHAIPSANRTRIFPFFIVRLQPRSVARQTDLISFCHAYRSFIWGRFYCSPVPRKNTGFLLKKRHTRKCAFFCLYRPKEMYLVSRYSSMPSCPPSRPIPLSFIPPNGACAADGAPLFQPRMP